MDDNEAVRCLEKCESDLRRLIASAVVEGNYGAVVKVTSWARVIGGLLEDARTGDIASGDPEAGIEASLQQAALTKSRSGLPKKAQKGLRSKPRGYPKFFRAGG
ncbi:MAG TPA: hypothetical protein VFY67_10885, partial [Pyrinomonadaceae bacterium]|nr:hypothetical protein [Pyrinomonadaceae bacterium]